MSAELDAKWLELVAAGRAEWMEGMLRIAPDPAPPAHADPWDDGPRRERYEEDAPFIEGWSNGPWYPVWDDPPTLGALLGQVRARYMDPTIYARPEHVEDGHGWTLYDALGVLDLRGRPRSGPDEVSALLRGLELAP